MSLTLTRRHNVDRFGYLIPHRYGNLPMVGAVATYRPGEGRFGGAVAVEEGTTNLVTNGNMANGTTGWNPNQKVTLSVVEEVTPFGTLNFLKVVSNQSASTPGVLSGEITVSSSTTYTYSLLGRRQAGSNAYLYVTAWDGSSWYGLVWAERILPTKFNRVSITFTTGSSDTKVKFGVLWDGASAGAWFEITQVQLEQKPFATSFVDGARSDGNLVYDTREIGITPEGDWTILGWYKKNAKQSVYDNWAALFQMGNYYQQGESEFQIWTNHYGDFKAWSHQNRSPRSKFLFTPNDDELTDWFFVGVTRENNSMRFYIHTRDRELVDSWTLSHDLPIAPRLRLGGRWILNGLIDELLILPYAASEEEIVSWYEAQGPLPPHPQALLQWDRQTVRPAQMVKL